ncbi:MAG: trimeric intracellular cation channel family protein [Saprospiraceae bacterium]|nr:trimeric intracellular cation channel family protein [Saprospiraceae bacterium]
MLPNLTFLLDILGTFAFAVSGIRAASRRQIDWFGAYIIGLVTAIGGGTMRDLLLGVPPFWMTDAKYFLTTGFALIATLRFKVQLVHQGKALLVFDTIGLGLFTVVGITKSMDAGLAPWVCIVMGTITGSLGGVIRDVLLNDIPLIFRRDIYALACVVGGAVYFLCLFLSLPDGVTEIVAALTVIVIRWAAIRFHIHLPQLQPMPNESGDTEP